MPVVLDFQYVIGGRNVGYKGWRDPADPNHVYQIRETNQTFFGQPQGFEGVRIDIRAGASTQLQFWDRALNYGALGACFANPIDQDVNTNLCGSVDGSKLYSFAASGSALAGYQNVIIEFNKADFSVSKFFNTDFTAAGVEPNWNGWCTGSRDGSYMVRVGSVVDLVLTLDSLIEIYRPSDDAWGKVNIFTALGLVGSIGGNAGFGYQFTAPVAFDDDGFLWTIAQPQAFNPPRTPYQTANSNLYKLSIVDLGGGNLGLAHVATFVIPDGFYPWVAPVAGDLTFAESFGYKHFTFEPARNVLRMWSSWRNLTDVDPQQAWYMEFDIASGTFSTAADWAGLGSQTESQHPQAEAFYDGDTFPSIRQANLTTPWVYLNLFRVPTMLQDQYLAADFPNYPFANNLFDETTLWHVDGGAGVDKVYVMDVDFINNAGGFQIFRDGIFTITTTTGVSAANKIIADLPRPRYVLGPRGGVIVERRGKIP